MRRTNWKTVSTLVTMAVVAGCQDRASTAPSSANTAVVSAQFAPVDRPQLSSNDVSNGSSNTTTEFTVSPNGGTYFVGTNAVVFPANSICDPATSSYGEGTWDQPCTPATSGVRIRAVVRTAKSGTWIDFTPALRFVPSSYPSRWVWLFMYNPAAASSNDVSGFAIKYAQTLGDLGVDESLTDATMRTYLDGALLLRRIKHFSGYTSSSGRACDPAVETDCYPDNRGGGVGGP